MLDALGQEVSYTKQYAVTQFRGGVRSTFIGTVSPVSETCVTMNVSETLCFNIDGTMFENRTWEVKKPQSIESVSLFPLDSLQSFGSK